VANTQKVEAVFPVFYFTDSLHLSNKFFIKIIELEQNKFTRILMIG